MKIGISTKCFGGISTIDATTKIKNAGFDTVELCLCQQDIPFWQYNCVGRAGLPDRQSFLNVCKQYRDNDIEIASLGTYHNLWFGSDEERYLAVIGFVKYLELAYCAGIDMVSLEFGFAPGTRPIRGATIFRYNYSDAEYMKMLDVFGIAVCEAKKRGIKMSLEPNRLDPLQTSDAYLRFIDDIENATGINDIIRFTLSPFSFSDTYNEGEFDAFADSVDMLHLKEREPGNAFFCPVGRGFDSWKSFLEKMKASKYAIVEYTDDRTAKLAREFMEDKLPG